MVPEGESYTPLERIVLTANGNLQRIISAFYNQPVTVNILKNQRQRRQHKEGGEKVGVVKYEREVELSCFGVVFCRAVSWVELSERKVVSLVEEQGVGIGQLFRLLHLLPEFNLLQVRKEP
jgi:hypothetical protein